MIRTVALVIAMLAAATMVAGAILARPSGFDRCVAIITAELERQARATAASIDPRDVELEAARTCAGSG